MSLQALASLRSPETVRAPSAPAGTGAGTGSVGALADSRLLSVGLPALGGVVVGAGAMWLLQRRKDEQRLDLLRKALLRLEKNGGDDGSHHATGQRHGLMQAGSILDVGGKTWWNGSEFRR